MSSGRKHYLARVPDPNHLRRVEAVRELAADLFALAERMTIPARSHNEAERLIEDAEDIAADLRAVFRG